MPAATCFSTISRTASERHASKAACSNGRPVSRASRNSSRSGGRGRLPTWVVRIRSVLVFIQQSPCAIPSSLLAQLRRFEHFGGCKYLRSLEPTPEGRHYSGIGGTGPAVILGGG